MNKDSLPDPDGAGLGVFAAAASEAVAGGLPPVHLWNPPHCGDIGLRIAADGTWFYRGSPIGRPALVRLFSRILRKDPEGHVLVTPVEKVSVAVEDAPFLAVELGREGDGPGRTLAFRTNVDDIVLLDAGHRLRFEPAAADGLKPYIHVRGDLWARVSRPLFYDLVELGEVREIDGRPMFGIASAGVFFPMASADTLEGLA